MNDLFANLQEPSRPLRFFWNIRPEDGAEVFNCIRPDGSSCEILSAAEIQTAEELITPLAAAPTSGKPRIFDH